MRLPARPAPPRRAAALCEGGRARYEEITVAISDQLARHLGLEDRMVSRIDALNLVSSLTLFRAATDSTSSIAPILGSIAQITSSAKQQSKVVLHANNLSPKLPAQLAV